MGQVPALELPYVGSELGCAEALYGSGSVAWRQHLLAGLALPASLPGPQTTGNQSCRSWWISMPSHLPAYLPPGLLFSFPKKAELGRRDGMWHSGLG